MEILWGLGGSWKLFFLHQSLWSTTNPWPPQVKYSFRGFSEYISNRNPNPLEVQLVVSNSQGIILILLLTVELRQLFSLLFPSAWWGCTVGKVLWTSSILGEPHFHSPPWVCSRLYLLSPAPGAVIKMQGFRMLREIASSKARSSKQAVCFQKTSSSVPLWIYCAEMRLRPHKAQLALLECP